MSQFSRFFKETDGATAIEYGLIAAGIGVGIMAVVFTLGGEMTTMFTEMQTKLGARAK